jgi:hypothetical protein
VRTPKYLIGIWLVIFGLTISGCTLFPKSTRPAPIRPRMKAPTQTLRPTPRGMMTPNPKVRTAPTKRTPGLSSVSKQSLLNEITRIEAAVKKGDWSMATRDTNTLGADMTRFRPNAPAGKTLREMGSFDATYLKLQANVRTKNKTATMSDLSRLRTDLNSLKKTS